MLFTFALLLMSNASGVHAAERDRWTQLASPVFRHYGPDEGLPNPIISAITESNDGFLWIGTEGGLARWDGYRFRVYRQLAGDAGALPDSLITALYADAAGRLWIGTNAGGLARYDRDHDCFITYPTGAGGLSNVHVRAIVGDGAHGVWVASDGGLDHVDGASGTITSLHHRAHDPASLPDDRIYAVLRDHSGRLWVGTGNGLVTRAMGDRFRPVSVGGTVPSAGTLVTALLEDTQGTIWIGTAHRGAFVVGPRGRVARPVRETAARTIDGASENLSDEFVWSMMQAGPNEVWLGTAGLGIVAVDMTTGRTRRIVHDALVRQSLGDDSVWALHRDRAGNLWVGTGVGVDLLSADARGPALTVFGDTSDPNGLSEADVVSVRAASNGRIWAGSNSKGLDIIDPERARVKNFAPNSNEPRTALPAGTILSLAEGPHGEMFIASLFGLYRTNVDATRVTRVDIPGRDATAGTRATYMSHGRLWIGGRDDGVWSLDPNRPSKRVEHLDSARLTDPRITTFLGGPTGDLWIGTRNGLNRLDLTKHTIERIPWRPKDPQGLANGYIATLLYDRLGRLWVGTSGGGIAILVRRDAGRPIFQRVGMEQGLPDNDVDTLMTDPFGRVWAATDNGIAVIDPVRLRVHTLHRAEGLAISAYWVGSGAKTKQGELLFGGEGGLTVIRPKQYRAWTYHPQLVVTREVTGGNLVPFGDGLPLVVKPDANSMSVEFSALDYSAPEQIRYAYRLEGFDQGWLGTDATNRIAAYTNLPPGDYSLHIRGSNRDGTWNELALNLPVRVLPAWYQTKLFSALIAMLTLMSVALLLQVRTAYLRRRQRELELQVAARTSELEDKKIYIERIAYHDALTNLPNRRYFNTELQKLIAQTQRHGHPLILLLIDLDQFKQINDTLGHDAGDALLTEVAKRMRAVLRASDFLARLGGDEFAVLLQDVACVAGDPLDVDTVCRRIIRCFDAVVQFNGADMKTSASIGIAAYTADKDTWESLYKASDLALYQAKRSGRNTWRWHESSALTTGPPSPR